MAAKSNEWHLLVLLPLVLALTVVPLNAQKLPSLQLLSTLTNTMLAQAHERTLIVGVDISPDASRLAVLYGTATDANSTPVYSELWLALWDIRAEKLLKRAELAKSDQNSDIFTVGPLDVKFTRDQQNVVILGLRQVWIVDSSNFSIRASVRALRSDLGSPAQILLVSDSDIAITYTGESGGPFHTDIYEIPPLVKVADWSSVNSPQSFSPRSQLAAMSDSNNYNTGGVSNIAVVSSRTGQAIHTIPVAFAFPKSWIGKREAHGTVVFRFINDKELIVAPDGSRDSAGHHSGDGVEVINAIDGHLERQIALDSFGPTGTIAESVNREWLALESIYAKPMWFSIESTNPSHFVHTVRLLKTDGSDSQFQVAWPTIQTADATSFPALTISPKISSVGPTAVITTGNVISVFAPGK